MILRSREASRNWQTGATIDRGTVLVALGAAALSGIVVAALAIMVESSTDDRNALAVLRGANAASRLCRSQIEPPRPLEELAKR
ncbi:MAG TPA: hypothetical protein VMV26_18445 [Alphaproteobacteria bacterium]|jgi:hypothetical protein|nr:hypothetical protein [Alphaproteobacteria bacterium]